MQSCVSVNDRFSTRAFASSSIPSVLSHGIDVSHPGRAYLRSLIRPMIIAGRCTHMSDWRCSTPLRLAVFGTLGVIHGPHPARVIPSWSLRVSDHAVPSYSSRRSSVPSVLMRCITKARDRSGSASKRARTPPPKKPRSTRCGKRFRHRGYSARTAV